MSDFLIMKFDLFCEIFYNFMELLFIEQSGE